MKRILVTFAGGTGGRGVSIALRASSEPVHLIAVDAEKFSLARSVADERHMVPRADAPGYLDFLRQIVEQTEPDLIWPNHDAEVGLIASDEHLSPLAFLPPGEVVDLCQDKAAASDAYSTAGVPIPPSRLINDEVDLKAAFTELGPELWIRLTRGAGGKGSTPVSDLDTARNWIDIHSGWGKFTAASNIKGERLNCETVWSKGKLMAAQGNTYVMPELGSLTRSGITGVSRANRWNNSPDILEISKKAVRAVMPEPNGIFSVDMLRDCDGDLHVTEINAGRFSNGGFTHSLSHGVNIAFETMKLALGEETSLPIVNQLPDTHLMIRGIDLEQFEVHFDQIDAPEHRFESLKRDLGLE